LYRRGHTQRSTSSVRGKPWPPDHSDLWPATLIVCAVSCAGLLFAARQCSDEQLTFRKGLLCVASFMMTGWGRCLRPLSFLRLPSQLFWAFCWAEPGCLRAVEKLRPDGFVASWRSSIATAWSSRQGLATHTSRRRITDRLNSGVGERPLLAVSGHRCRVRRG